MLHATALPSPGDGPAHPACLRSCPPDVPVTHQCWAPGRVCAHPPYMESWIFIPCFDNLNYLIFNMIPVNDSSKYDHFYFLEGNSTY